MGATSAGRRLWIGVGLGGVIAAIGLRGLLIHAEATRPTLLLRFLVGGLVLNDLIGVPTLIGLGVIITRTVPGWARATVQAGLVVCGSLILYSYPLVRGYGRASGNPSSLPHNYAANLAVVLAVVWIVLVGVLIRRYRRRPPAS
ncbi:MAG: hypothetical protein ACT4OS_08770 [Acidimicrobiales bacterium]